MLRVSNLSLPLDYDEAALMNAVARRLNIPRSRIRSLRLARQSVDARDRADVHFVLTVEVRVDQEQAVLKKCRPGAAEIAHRPAPLILPSPAFAHPPVVVGAGPAGLFAALTLAQAGARPLLLERGKPVEERTRDVDAMRDQGLLNPESNVQFGEGGAGAFSDGKLTTGIKSPLIRDVLETFVAHGAPEEILWLNRPHIGTDLLRGVVASIRREIIRLGGQVLFSTRMTGLELNRGRIAGVRALRGEEELFFPADAALLCLGHSARDTLQTLFLQGVRMTQKPFAVGVRIEHRQAMIDKAQYGTFAGHPRLRAADYRLSVHTPDGRGVYTFCMCPGGEVIAAASQPGGVAVNGMSRHARDGINANAALLVGVRPGDFGDDHPLAGFVWQRSLEQAAYRAGGGGFIAPAQRLEDFLAGRPSAGFGEVTPSYRPGVSPADLGVILPSFVTDNLRWALPRLDGQLHGFAHPDAALTAVEARSSSPVRLPRNRDGMAEGIDGLFPVGEGAGYAGGIVSAAVDGITAARAALQRSHEL